MRVHGPRPPGSSSPLPDGVKPDKKPSPVVQPVQARGSQVCSADHRPRTPLLAAGAPSGTADGSLKLHRLALTNALGLVGNYASLQGRQALLKASIRAMAGMNRLMARSVAAEADPQSR